MAPPSPKISDRRSNHRYPINVPLEYRVVLGNGAATTGVARTVNLSTGGVLFEGMDTLPAGFPIQLSMEWPSQLGKAIGMKLHGSGITVRSLADYTAVALHQHEFR